MESIICFDWDKVDTEQMPHWKADIKATVDPLSFAALQKIFSDKSQKDLPDHFWISEREASIQIPPTPVIELPVFDGYKD